MVFSSPVFLFLFLPITFLLVLLAGNVRRQNTLLLVASLLFYAWGEGGFLLLMLGAALFNHACAALLDRTRSPKAVVVFAVLVDLSVLVWYKYAGFIVHSINMLISHWGARPIELDPVHLPIGISFFTFHSISYVVDIYRKKATAQKSPGITSLYIALFPQLVAGPIIRYHDVATQFTERIIDVEGIAAGIRRFIVGLAKKVLVADLCARIADPIFDLPHGQLTPSVAWLGLVAYAVQIYFDFSGYSDMAIGLGRMFGFHFLENFNRPYVASSLREFWKRWHISLTNFFRDYVYIPLGGNRGGNVRTYTNLLVVFFLTGLWHGASWNFVVWGMLHGAFMLAERIGLGRLLERAPRLAGQSYMLLVVLTTWVFFRAPDLGSSLGYLQAMWTPHHGDPSLVYPSYYLTTDVVIALLVGIIGGIGLYDPIARGLKRIASARGSGSLVLLARDAGLVSLFVLIMMAVATRTYDPFIYFRF